MRRLSWSLRFLFCFAMMLMMNWRSALTATAQTSVTDSMEIYYEINENDTGSTGCLGRTTLREFIKHTLPFEWPPESRVMEHPEGIEAFKAGAVAVRTNAVTVYHTREIIRGGTTYLCVIYGRQNHLPNLSLDNFPSAQQAVIATNNIILTHPHATNHENDRGRTIRTGAIDAQYRDETGYFTQEGPYPWTKEVHDPISPGIAQTGMGQEGTRRWSWGRNDAGIEFPKWDYRRILAHYYSEVDFVGISPDPPNNYRVNILETQGIPPNGGLVLCKGEERTGITINSQNTGNTLSVNNASQPGACSGLINPQTLLGYHLYNQNGTQACGNCIGLRNIPLCYPGGSVPPVGSMA